MAEKKVTIQIDVQKSDAEKKIKGFRSFIEKFGVSRIGKGLSALGSTVSGIQSAFSIAGKTLGLVTESIERAVQQAKELDEAYKTQANAEIRLSNAVKNNPLLNGESEKALKDFAGQLQATTTYGDETTIPMMSRLAAAGRSQAEIMEIMSVATDMAASGDYSLSEAVDALNRSYSGTATTLARSVKGIKSLSKEQLATGEAVKIMGERYAGMAEKLAKATGGTTQLGNELGDLKEKAGEAVRGFFKPLENALTSLARKLNEWWGNYKEKRREAESEYLNGTSTVEEDEEVLEMSKERIERIQSESKELSELKSAYDDYNEKRKSARKELYEKYGSKWQKSEEWQSLLKEGEELENNIRKVTKSTASWDQLGKIMENTLSNAEEETQMLNERVEKLSKTLKNVPSGGMSEEQEKLLSRRDSLRASYTSAIEAEEARIQAEEKAGKKISESEKAQRLYNVALSKYIEMMSDPAFDRSLTQTGMWEGEQEMLNQIAGYATASFDTEAARKNFASFFPDKKTAEEEVTEYYTAQMEALQKLYDSLPEEYQKDFADDFAQAGERLATAQKEAMEKVHADERAELYSHLERSLEIVQNFIGRYAEVCSGISEIITQNAEAAATSQTLAIEKQYAAGKLSAEQYEKSLKEIEHKKAQESYRAQMWQWTANLAQATASTAQAVIQTLADATLPTAARIAMSAIIGAAGAAQLATVIGSKPIPPSFSTGGIVGGSSYYGDRISANVNSGEMILTRAQQRLLFDTINRGSMNGSMTNNVTIKNYASPDVSATVRQDGKALEVYIQKTVASQMEKGAYNRSLAIASMGMSGEKYTS